MLATSAKRLLCLFAVVLACSAFAQVPVPAAVIDASGAPVHGLQKADFSLSCVGPATLDAIEEIAPATVPRFADPIPVFVLYDPPSLERPVQARVVALLLHMLRSQAAQGLPVTLLKNNGTSLEIIHDMSVDPAVLTAALDRVAPDKAKSPSPRPMASSPADFEKKVDEASARLRQLLAPVASKAPATPGGIKTAGAGRASGEQRIASLQTVAKMLQRSRSRKLLLWITGWLPVKFEKSMLLSLDGYYGVNGCSEYEKGELGCGAERFSNPGVGIETAGWGSTIRALNDSRISLYPLEVNSEGDVTDRAVRGADSGAQNGIENLARTTGGVRVLTDTPVDMDEIMARLRHELAPYYMLSVSIPSDEWVGWTACSFSTGKPGVKVITGEGFFGH